MLWLNNCLVNQSLNPWDEFKDSYISSRKNKSNKYVLGALVNIIM